MTHVPDEEQLALYAGNDLSPEETRVVAQHVTECLACQCVLEEYRAAHQVLSRNLCDPESGELQLLRARVLGQITTPPATRGWWRAAGLAAAAAALAIAYLSTTQPVSRPAAVPELRASLPVENQSIPTLQGFQLQDVSEPAKTARKHRPAAGLRRAELRASRSGDSTLEIETADPNVRIMLLMGGKAVEE